MKIKTFKQAKELEIFTLPNDDKKITYMKMYNKSEKMVYLMTVDGYVENFLNDDDIVEIVK